MSRHVPSASPPAAASSSTPSRRTLFNTPAASSSTISTASSLRTGAVRVPVGAGAGGGSTTATSSSSTTVSATPTTITQVGTTKSAEQRDRARLDARLSTLLLKPFDHAAEARSIFQADVNEEAHEAHLQRMNVFRQLEARMEQDDWMY